MRFILWCALLICIFPVITEAKAPANRAVTTNTLLLDVAFAGDKLVAVGERGLVLLSDDLGESWQVAPLSNKNMLTSVFFLNAQTGWITGHSGSLLKTIDGGLHWSEQKTGIENDPLFDVYFRDDNHGYAVGAFGIFLRTNDGGQSWQQDFISDQDVHWYLIREISPGILIVAGESGIILRSDDGGNKWQAIESPYAGSMFNAIQLPQGNSLLLGLRGNLLFSSDVGLSWNNIQTPFPVSLQGGCATMGGDIVVGGLGGVLFVVDRSFKDIRPLKIPGFYNVTQALALNADQLIIVGNFGATKINISSEKNK